MGPGKRPSTPQPGCGATAEPVAVVTGDSRGLGAALVAALVKRGFSVAGCATTDVSPDGVVLHRMVDVADPTAVEAFADEVTAHLGAIDLWINNAAVVGPIGSVRTTSPEAWDRAVAVNILGVVAGARAFLSRRAERAVLVNIASRAGLGAVAGLAAYGATKAAVIALTRSVSEEECHDGVRASVVIPPSLDTDMQDILLRREPATFPGALEARHRRDEGRIVAPTDAAEVILRAVLDEHHHHVVIDLTDDQGEASRS